MDVDDWIDSAEIERYDLSVYDSSETAGDLLAYRRSALLTMNRRRRGRPGGAHALRAEPGQHGVATWAPPRRCAWSGWFR
jgi:hypothetical protein